MTLARGAFARGGPARTAEVSSIDRREPLIRPSFSSNLRHCPTVDLHDVGREVVCTTEQRRANAVGVDRQSLTLEARDALSVEAARDDDLHLLEAGAVRPLADLAYKRRADALKIAPAPALARET